MNNDLRQQLEEALTLIFDNPADAQDAANTLLETEDANALSEFNAILANAKAEILEEIRAHKEHVQAIQELVRELGRLKADIDTDAFLLKLAKKLQ